MADRWPFVGREQELARATALLASGAGVCLVGSDGVGKSALARTLRDRAARSGAVVGHVVGHAVSDRTPFEVFAGVVGSAQEPAAHEFGVPEVADRLAATLGRGADPRPLLLVDDVQLIDERSAQVLLAITAGGGVSVVTTAPADRPVPPAVERLWRDGLCERIELAPLSVQEVGELLGTVLGGPVDPRCESSLAMRSGGNPLFLRELVGAAVQAALFLRQGDSGLWTLTAEPPVTSGIREMVTARLAQLPPGHRGALELVAAGEPVPATVAGDLVGDAVLDELEADRLITVHDGLAGPVVRTAHPIYGDVLRSELPRLRLHRLRLALAHRLELAANPSPHDLVRAAVWRLDSGRAGDPDRLLAAARAAQGISLPTAQRLARHAYETSGSLPAAVLLAEILTHNGNSAEAAELTARLPPASLSQGDREALVYCAAMGEGLLVGDPGRGVDLVAGVLAGASAASDQLRALYAVLLAFDARFETALEVGVPIVEDSRALPGARALAAVGAVGASYWLGRHSAAVALADRVALVTEAAREVEPFGPASIELMAICALAEQGDLDAAAARARRMRRVADAEADEFAGPRADYCLGRVALLRGQAGTARELFARCLAEHSPFDHFIRRHLGAMLARAQAACGDPGTAESTLASCAGTPPLKTYEPEDELAHAAVLAASLRMGEAADRAAWAAGVAAAQSQWSAALAGYHDAARYGHARRVLMPMREAVTFVDGTLAWCYLDHVAALASRDAIALDEVARRFESHGCLLLAAEARAAAAPGHAAAGHPRPARVSSTQAGQLWARCGVRPSPWLVGASTAVPLTARERQVAALASSGLTDAAIAARLVISIRTVQTHLGHVYDKVGSAGRSDLAARLDTLPHEP